MKQINMENNNLVFSTYKENAFKRDVNFHKTQYIDVEDGRFISLI